MPAEQGLGGGGVVLVQPTRVQRRAVGDDRVGLAHGQRRVELRPLLQQPLRLLPRLLRRALGGGQQPLRLEHARLLDGRDALARVVERDREGRHLGLG